ncbi:hypothetical protein Peur_072197 [Populus x canadensis]
MFFGQKLKTSFFNKGDKGTRHTILIDVVVARSGPCLDDSTYDLLFALMSNDVVKEALFSIGNEKAPGLDGYSFLFFKKSWNVIGNDLCAAIKDFFILGELLKQVNHSIIALMPKSSNVTLAADFKLIFYCVMFLYLSRMYTTSSVSDSFSFTRILGMTGRRQFLCLLDALFSAERWFAICCAPSVFVDLLAGLC